MMIGTPWDLDEDILVLDLYFRTKGGPITSSNSELIRTRDLLDSLYLDSSEISEGAHRRSILSIKAKIGNFTYLDPNHRWEGMSAVSSQALEVWNRFSNDTDTLESVVKIISGHGAKLPESDYLGAVEFPEGRAIERIHRGRERNPTIVMKVKEKAEKEGRLNCWVCGFDFGKFYGDIGEGYIECHHDVPISEYGDGRRTRIQDLTLVCSNCHRVLHRKRPWMSVGDLRRSITPIPSDSTNKHG